MQADRPESDSITEDDILTGIVRRKCALVTQIDTMGTIMYDNRQRFTSANHVLTWWIGGMVALCCLSIQKNDAAAADSDSPNVILFFIDDLGYMDLGCYGSEFHETPNIDALAQKGIRFTNFYSANPVCSPTRAALMSGKAPQRLGITQWIGQPSDIHLPLEEVTIGEALASAGYRNGYIGKWHLGEKDNQQPREQGFTWMRGVNRAGQPASYFFPFKRKKNKHEIHYWDVPDLEDGKKGDYLNDRLTDHALSFISENQKRPFFLCFAHYAVHTPIQAPKVLKDKYRQKLNSVANPKDPPFVPERNDAKSRLHQDNPAYAAMVENLDHNIGRVVDHLDQLKLTQNTIILFTSDNGGLSTLQGVGPTSCRPLRAGKGWTYEGGIRIPTIIAWPGQIKPGVCHTPGITMDIYPTLLDLVGAPQRPKQHLDGQSLCAAMTGEAGQDLDSRFLAWTYPHHHGSLHSPSNAIRLGPWKLVELTDKSTPASQRFELYKLASDLSETNNLAEKEPEKVDELSNLLSTWLDETSVSQPPN